MKNRQSVFSIQKSVFTDALTLTQNSYLVHNCIHGKKIITEYVVFGVNYSSKHNAGNNLIVAG